MEFDLKVIADENEPFASQFELREQIGKGAFGGVFKAVHIKSGNLVAIKKQDVFQDLEDITREINFMKEFNCPYSVNFYGKWFESGTMWIAMEYCAFGSVRDVYVLRGRGFPEQQISLICKYVLKGLKILHAMNKIHRDIKSDNILINELGQPKIGDFGVSVELQNANQRRMTVIGTPHFLAPEVVENDDGYGSRVDIWSLGISLIEMVETATPYYTMEPMKVLFSIPSNPPPTLQNPELFSNEINDFLSKCLTKDPKERPSAEELLKHEFITKHDSEEKDIREELIQMINEELVRHQAIRRKSTLQSIPNKLNTSEKKEVKDTTLTEKEPIPPEKQEQVSQSEYLQIVQEKERLQKELEALKSEVLNELTTKSKKSKKKEKKEKKSKRKSKEISKETLKKQASFAKQPSISSVTSTNSSSRSSESIPEISINGNTISKQNSSERVITRSKSSTIGQRLSLFFRRSLSKNSANEGIATTDSTINASNLLIASKKADRRSLSSIAHLFRGDKNWKKGKPNVKSKARKLFLRQKK